MIEGISFDMALSLMNVTRMASAPLNATPYLNVQNLGVAGTSTTFSLDQLEGE